MTGPGVITTTAVGEQVVVTGRLDDTPAGLSIAVTPETAMTLADELTRAAERAMDRRPA